jgi:uncharacterized protein YutE (UPF0331/DUF86 family)
LIVSERKVLPVVSQNTIESILSNLENYQAKLSILANYPKELFLQDFTKVESAKHLLQVSIGCCLDIAHHIVADEGYRTAKDYYDTFVILNEKGIVPDSFMPALRQMVNFRNQVVHLSGSRSQTGVWERLCRTNSVLLEPKLSFGDNCVTKLCLVTSLAIA